MKWLSVMLALAALLSSCDVPARVTQGPVTSWIPPNAGPELVAVPVGNLNVVMEPGLVTQEDTDAALSPVRGYVPGSGVLLATYPGPSRVDIYRLTSLDLSLGPGPDGPMTCTAEVTFGQHADGWSCDGGTMSPPSMESWVWERRKVIVVTAR